MRAVPTRTRRLLGAVAAVLLLALVAGCQGMGGTNGAGYIGGENVSLIDAADRSAPVEISGTTLQGAPLDLADDRGKVSVVNVWWSGCGPCIAEMPKLVSAQRQLKGTPFVGIDIRDNSQQTALAFQNAQGADYPSLFDPGSTTLLALGKYAPSGPPTTYVLDTQGRVAAVFAGGIPSTLTLVDVVHQTAAEDG